MTFAVGSLVKARGREWVVLPESADEMLILRPLGGTEDEVTGIYLPLERVESAQFDLPDTTQPGDYRSSRLLRDAVRLGFRSSAGPFRSFARIAVEPRPYQLVPLLMALKLDPVRLLIADDVGIGKTIEAGLIARELIDRGEMERLAVLCPPQLAEQWQVELHDKFHIDAELVLPGTATSLERNCHVGQSLFDLYPFVIVSMDFIKSDRRRDEFLRTCPELVIVDEAHTCAYGGEGRGGQHQRHHLVSGLAANLNRHLILVTATPHSGNEAAFRSLLSLLNPDFAELPDDLTGKENEQHRRNLATQFVQRKRGDIRRYMETDTPFPTREGGDLEETYKLSDDYKRLFDRVLKYAREIVTDPANGNQHRQRVQWWSALALLRSLASSPSAAAATLRTRAASADTETVDEANEIGRRGVLDIVDDESAEGIDLPPGADYDEGGEQGNRRRLLQMAREAEALKGDQDAKLQKAITLIKGLIKDGYQPIVFCRFIPTAEYVAEALRKALPKGVEVAAVTGLLPPEEREARVIELGQATQHVLVATDCLSEGVNLQEHFNAVLHYDLSWNPTRHEQREGRVDRYGQPRPTIRAITYYGVDNQIDGIVLDVLIRKYRTIRNSLGISVPVPIDTDQVVEAIFEGLLLREKASSAQQLLPGLEEYLRPQKEDLNRRWDASAEREKRSRTMFAQVTIKVEDVARELKATQAAIGSGVDVAAFTKEAFRAHGAVVSEKRSASEKRTVTEFNLTEIPVGLAEAVGSKDKFVACFELPVQDEQKYLSRTHPIVEGLATYVMDTALDPIGEAIARRCGVIRTSKVEKRTTLLLLRFRYHILTKRGETEQALLAEDCQLLAFAGSPQSALWLDGAMAEELLLAQPDANVHAEQARDFLQRVLDGFEALRPHLDEVAVQRGEVLLEQHRRVRTAARMQGVSHRVEPQLPPDVLGVYVYLPKAL
ncbi:RNA polymerase-associated protein RapA [Anaerolineae bacterium]|nr:RNA polymerase-associated protein RapA [Anaerolineae bacterium]